jgi:phospholipid N-methyltransferase
VKIDLNQRHRSGLQFLGAVQAFAGAYLQGAARMTYDQQVPEPPLELEARKASVAAVLGASPYWLFDRFITRWVAEEVYAQALPAIESVRPAVEQWLAVQDPSGSLDLEGPVDVPAYWQAGFHLTPGGWDGHELMGPVIAELVFNYVLTVGGVGAVRTGEKLDDQRLQVAREALDVAPHHIVELGAGTGRFTFALRAVFPTARITAVELSVSSLRHAYALASKARADIDWLRANAECTGLPEASAQLVALYTLLHEVPQANTRLILAETFRLLAPGGTLLIGEIAPYSQQTAFRAVVLDWETEHRGEPYWREAMALDVPQALSDAGFVDIRSHGVGVGVYPWVTRARKP